MHLSLKFLAMLALAASLPAQIADFTFSGQSLASVAQGPLATVTPLTSPQPNMFGSANGLELWCTTSVWARNTEQGPFNHSQNYVEFCVTPTGVCALALSRIVIDSWRGGSARDHIEFAGVYIDEDPGSGGDNFQTRVAVADVFPQEDGLGTATLDLSGFAPLQCVTHVLKIRIYFWGDSSSGTSNAEFDRIRLEGTCAPTLLCDGEYATRVVGTFVGANQNSSKSDPTAALGDTSGSWYSLGRNGRLAVAFSGNATNSGDNRDDIMVDEYGHPDCYFTDVLPANADTRAALLAAGLLEDAMGFIRLGAVRCGDANFDLDTIVPGRPQGSLRIAAIRIVDDGTANDGTEIARIKAWRCNEGRIGDFIFMDSDCNGIQGGQELGLMGVTVNLLDVTGTQVLAQVVTMPDGRYEFEVAPGTYFLRLEWNGSLITPSPKNVGNDRSRDSDLDPQTGLIGPITVGPNQVRDEFDAGFCAVCVGQSATVDANFPACGLAIEPILTSTRPILGSLLELGVQSPFPDALVLILGRVAPPQRFEVFTGAATCNVWIDPTDFVVIFTGLTDVNGNWNLIVPMPADPAFIGFQITIQARVCSPAIPGPIPGFPDWLTNAVALTFGCP